ncbi:hypothetical protein BKA62DRAFT_176919 [Auriculariales sp. MPI-PUGE-AT-0066]|nr:hypothetical protein BKA62DRAFT_176919 [Auriculariales sp. MPI-PUGE-AT-0066]
MSSMTSKDANTLLSRRSDPSHATQATVPMQSIRGALYLEAITRLGPWRLLISSRAARDLRNMRNGDDKMFRIVMKELKQLSDGYFSRDNQTRLTRGDVAIPVFEARMTGDKRLVYRVDCITEYGRAGECQVLVIYGVYTYAQRERGDFWNFVGRQLSRRGREYQRRCAMRSQPVGLKGDKVYVPEVFGVESDASVEQAIDLSGLAIPQSDLAELHDLLVLEKFVPFSQALLTSILANIDVTHPFHPSPHEKMVIEYEGSCYVAGRSGTGKTTTILFRLLAREQIYRAQNGGGRKPRQLFVTQSRVLASKVEEYYRKLHESISIADQRLKDLERRKDLALPRVNYSDDLVPVDDEQEYRSDLPSRFSELQDEHFPLFLTMEKLYQMIEADMAAGRPEPAPAGPAGPSSGVRKLLSYTTWRAQYWPHFPQHLTKDLDPALVYSEIMGVIKGSGESLLREERYLDATSYETFSTRRQATFANQRSCVYEIFTAYQREKRLKGHVDQADRTHTILASLQSDTSIIGLPINYLYVDEVQDNLLIDALLLRNICCNPDGLFWAGDTAQTISVGSSFKFADLKAFLYSVEKKRLADMSKSFPSEPPEMFQLTVNYRSHGGIVKCAHSMIDLISRFWPDSIDNLAAEQSVVDGTKPLFFTGEHRDGGRALYNQLFLDHDDQPVDFGAHQCIIVRHEAAKAWLEETFGEVANILTVFEAKGLEFDDVLIFDFFHDSTVSDKQWRVILNALPHPVSCDGVPAPAFDTTRHAGVCSELKSLYVAITRARKNVWIVDRSQNGEPMRAFWTAHDLVQNLAASEVSHIATSSSPEEWSSRAQTFFKNGNFSQARRCFARATQPYHAAVAHAFHLRAIAGEKEETTSRHLRNERARAYLDAGSAFEAVASANGNVFNEREIGVYFRYAGECLRLSGKEHLARAAGCFEKADKNMVAAEVYREAAHFDDAVRVIRTHELESQPAAAVIMNAAKLHYFRNGHFENGCDLFDSVEDATQYLENRGLDITQAAVLEHMNRNSDAAKVHIREGRLLAAAKALLNDETDNSARRARELVLEAISRQIAFGRIPRVDDPEVQQIFLLLAELKSWGLTDGISDEINFFSIAVHQDVGGLYNFALKRVDGIDAVPCNKTNEEQGKLLLALHLYFYLEAHQTSTVDKEAMTTRMIVDRFKLTLNLVILLRAHGASKDPLRTKIIQRLFGFRPHEEQQFIVSSGTFMHSQICDFPGLSKVHGELLVPAALLQQQYQHTLLQLVQDLLIDMTGLWSEKGALDIPCMNWFFTGTCANQGCQSEHIREDDYVFSDYVLRVKAHVLPLMILAAVDGLIPRQDLRRQERIWSEKLYQALRPISKKLGDPTMLAAMELSHPGALAWIRPQMYDLRQWQLGHITAIVRHTFFTSVYCSDAAQARRMLTDIPLLADPRALRIDGTQSGPLALGYAIDGIYGPSNVEDCFIRGIEFLQLIISHGYAIEASVFMDMFEDVTTRLFVARNIVLRRSVDSVTFPRNWLLLALRHLQCRRTFSLEHVYRLVAIGRDYLFQMLHLADSGLYHITPTRPIGAIFRDILIGRMCHALGLIGLNSNHARVQDKVVGAVQVLHRRRPNSLNQAYYHANTWKGLLNVTRSRFSLSIDDCMVKVSRIRLNNSHLILMNEGVHQVTFRSWPELIVILRGIAPLQSVQVAARLHVSSTSSPYHRSPGRARGRTNGETRLETLPAGTHSGEGDNEDDVEPVSAPPAAALDEPHHHVAACRIQRWVRQRLSREVASKNHTSLRLYFKDYLRVAEETQCDNNYYRKIILGPLPHLMMALQFIEIKVLAVKAKIKDEFQSTDPALPVFDMLDRELTQINNIHKELKAHREQVKPGASLHAHNDVVRLEELVEQSLAFLRSVTFDLPRLKFDDAEREEYEATLFLVQRGVIDKAPSAA